MVEYHTTPTDYSNKNRKNVLRFRPGFSYVDDDSCLILSPRDMYALMTASCELRSSFCCPPLFLGFFAALTLGDMKTMKLKRPCSGASMLMVIVVSTLG